MPTKTDHDMIVEMHTVIFKNGLLEQVRKNTKAIGKLWIAVAVIATSIGGGVYGAIELLKGM
uniref:Uncharacterized protein n=1 Tax=viral metagenome TaxID=1070528 RepID=A0A6M3KYS2_9ZZZZ